MHPSIVTLTGKSWLCHFNRTTACLLFQLLSAFQPSGARILHGLFSFSLLRLFQTFQILRHPSFFLKLVKCWANSEFFFETSQINLTCLVACILKNYRLDLSFLLFFITLIKEYLTHFSRKEPKLIVFDFPLYCYLNVNLLLKLLALRIGKIFLLINHRNLNATTFFFFNYYTFIFFSTYTLFFLLSLNKNI